MSTITISKEAMAKIIKNSSLMNISIESYIDQLLNIGGESKGKEEIKKFIIETFLPENNNFTNEDIDDALYEAGCGLLENDDICSYMHYNEASGYIEYTFNVTPVIDKILNDLIEQNKIKFENNIYSQFQENTYDNLMDKLVILELESDNK